MYIYACVSFAPIVLNPGAGLSPNLNPAPLLAGEITDMPCVRTSGVAVQGISICGTSLVGATGRERDVGPVWGFGFLLNLASQSYSR